MSNDTSILAPGTMPTIEIRCVELNAKYTMRHRGGGTVETFTSVEEAILQAGRSVAEETRLMIFDVAGNGIVVTTLSPLR